jgi:hypothetical protein
MCGRADLRYIYRLPGSAEHVEVRDDAAPGQPFPEASEGVLDARAVEQRRGVGHAASIS